MGGKGGGGGAPMMELQPVVGHADPIDLTQNQAYINAQRAAAAATAQPIIPPVANVGGGDTTGAVAAKMLAPPQYWFNQPVQTLQAANPTQKGSMVTTDTGSV
jgi:hypothetical protein